MTSAPSCPLIEPGAWIDEPTQPFPVVPTEQDAPRGFFAALAAPEPPIAPGKPYKVVPGARVTFYRVLFEPQLYRQKTSDGQTYAKVVSDALWQIGLRCGLQFRLTKDLRRAHFAFYVRNGWDIYRKTGHSGYIYAPRGARDIELGDRSKPEQGEKPLPAEAVHRFAINGFAFANGLWGYGGWPGETWHKGGNPGQDHRAMRNTNFSGGLPAWDSAEEAYLRRYFGPAWLTK